jgi:hypothetical protein
MTMIDIAPDEDEAAEIIGKYGDTAVDHMIDRIKGAVASGDDIMVGRLDRILRLIERPRRG